MTKDACPDCGGKGWIELRCTREGEETVCSLCRGSGSTHGGVDCPGCHGTGLIEVRTVEQQKCLHCRGTGRFPVLEAL